MVEQRLFSLCRLAWACRAIVLFGMSTRVLVEAAGSSGSSVATPGIAAVASAMVPGLVTVAQLGLLGRYKSHPSLLVSIELTAGVLLLVIASTRPYGEVFVAAGCFALGALQGLAALPGWLILGLVAVGSSGDGSRLDALLTGPPVVFCALGLAGSFSRAAVLREADVGRRAAEATLRAGTLAERARVARELHDSVTKTLQGAVLAVSVLRREADRSLGAGPGEQGTAGPSTDRGPDRLVPARLALVLEIERAVGAASQQATELLDAFRSSEDPEDLSESVRHTLETWENRTRHRVQSRLEQVPATPEVAVEALGVLREALLNVERHARATTVRVDLHQPGPSHGYLTIEDDGQGFPVRARSRSALQSGHYGLLGMAERAAAAGGRLQVESRPGSGTRVVLRFPV